MNTPSLRRRLILGAAVWLALGLGAGILVLGQAFRDAVEHGFHERLDAHLRALIAVVETDATGAAIIGRPVGEPRFEQPYSGWYWQVSDGVTVKARSRSLWDFALPTAHAPESGAVHYRRDTGPRGEALEVAERDLILPGATRPLHVAVAAGRAKVDAEVQHFDLLLVVASGILALGLMGAIAIQVSFGLRPLARLAGALESLRDRGGRLDGAYPAEVVPLVQALNRVLDHDAQLIETARTHMGNLAHALKTPLAVLRGELGTAAPDTTILTDQTARLAHLVDLHLGRARAEAVAAHAPGQPVPVAEVAEDMARALRKIHAERGLTLTVAAAPQGFFRGSRDDLSELLGNLMDNACKWAAREVRVSADSRTVTVEDDGPGLTPEQVAAATRRGRRLDESAPGSGLGLAIVTDLAAMLGLSLEFDRSDVLGGLRVRLGLRPDTLLPPEAGETP